ncbi:FAD-binding monooxygenase [Nakamurella flava]|uniref:FAD-binding monooxygenase n=1 Tax=Nakamurella flava TaxID=2576308 RepID=A0A4U6QBZ6_9ACTN|nr:FAD-dependent monooxygenase [Nakamurella flava]TKV57416.1 FAD-binding monooxygenase [Nakamurella flava]
MTPRHVLISGAGIAGPTLAWWLVRYGFRCTVVERFAELRTGGQNIDIRGAAREVLRRMGLDDEVGARGTGEIGTRFVDCDGRAVGEFPQTPGETDGPTAEREVLRGQFAELLHERTRDDVDYRFGVQVDRIEQPADGAARVTLTDGTTLDCDVVVLAEGINSRTRGRLADAFGVHERRLGVSIGYFSVPRVPADAQDGTWWRWYNATGGRSITLRPDNVGRQRVTLSFRSAPVAADLRSMDAQKDVLRRRFAGAGWQSDRILAALPDVDDLYLEDLGQVRADRWSDGRVALLGDAAWCASPVSGMGTSLALVGAYVLAGELAAHVHHQDALARYEERMRPYVTRAQKLPPGAPGVMHPRTRLGVAALRTAFRVAAAGPLRRFETTLFQPPADQFVLPDYRHLRAVETATTEKG